MHRIREGSAKKTIIALALAGAVFAGSCPAQKPTAAIQVEPGLERAVRWKWQVEPSPKEDWGLALAAELVQPIQPSSISRVAPGGQTSQAAMTMQGLPATYMVRRGDALILIAKRFKITVAQLKEANNLTSDTIRTGQELNIPPPLPPAAATPQPRSSGATRPDGKSSANLEAVTLQVFLDREQFSPGPIDGQRGPTFERVLQLYQSCHPDAATPEAVLKKAQSISPFTTYVLQPADFRFIAPPKAERPTGMPAPAASPTPKRKSAPPPTLPQARPSYDDLKTAPLLAYRSPWEFVAERFHCDASYLRSLNPQISGVPAPGAELRVPNVVPFLIDRAVQPPYQPTADPQSPITTAVTGLSMLEIYRGGTLIAAMPIAIARPGLRGKGSWTILDAIPRPQLITRREPLVKVEPVTRIFGRETPGATPTPAPTPLPVPERLAPGPRNPAGIFWINLAKSDSPEPLPYGLHGTSIPDHMQAQQSLGGLRLTNWDIARAVRLLPAGTPLEWKLPGLMAPPAVAQPAAPAQ
jgi:LysM repeat protein